MRHSDSHPAFSEQGPAFLMQQPGSLRLQASSEAHEDRAELWLSLSLAPPSPCVGQDLGELALEHLLEHPLWIARAAKILLVQRCVTKGLDLQKCEPDSAHTHGPAKPVFSTVAKALGPESSLFF